jgi:hypothetical protein
MATTSMLQDRARVDAMLEDARNNVRAAHKAHRSKEYILRDCYLQAAADRFRACELEGLADYCERRIGNNVWR